MYWMLSTNVWSKTIIGSVIILGEGLFGRPTESETTFVARKEEVKEVQNRVVAPGVAALFKAVFTSSYHMK